MTKLFSFGLNILADVFYPKYCFGCRKPGNYLCKLCINQISALEKTFCVVCNEPSPNGYTHLDCKAEYTPERLLSALPYQNDIISDMVITGKYYFIPETFQILSALAADILLQNHIDVFQNELQDFVICPLPLHSQRLKWRGFNQTEIISNIFSQAFSIPVAHLLIRTKQTKTQKDLDADQRKTNMLNAFQCQYQPPEKVILVDDVTTTGQTFLEAAKALKQQGAKPCGASVLQKIKFSLK